jgi:hypothetical protein
MLVSLYRFIITICCFSILLLYRSVSSSQSAAAAAAGLLVHLNICCAPAACISFLITILLRSYIACSFHHNVCWQPAAA